MVKVRLKEIPRGGSNTYQTPQGISYTFYGTRPLEIADKVAIEFFKTKDCFIVEKEPKKPKKAEAKKTETKTEPT